MTQGTPRHFIYGKTPKASDSVAIHPHRLAQRYRRVLALVDGNRTVEELATVSRPGELEETLAYLQMHGFIVKIGEARDPEVFPDSDDPFVAAALTPDMFEEFKIRAVAQLNERFGQAASAAVEQIGRSKTPRALREALRNSEGLLTAAAPELNQDEIRQFIMRIGRNFV